MNNVNNFRKLRVQLYIYGIMRYLTKCCGIKYLSKKEENTAHLVNWNRFLPLECFDVPHRNDVVPSAAENNDQCYSMTIIGILIKHWGKYITTQVYDRYSQTVKQIKFRGLHEFMLVKIILLSTVPYNQRIFATTFTKLIIIIMNKQKLFSIFSNNWIQIIIIINMATN